jgi:hypothetical protein
LLSVSGVARAWAGRCSAYYISIPHYPLEGSTGVPIAPHVPALQPRPPLSWM